MSLDQYRKQINDLNKERDKAIMQKGLAAQDNNDLRENSIYDFWVEKEAILSAKIQTIIVEIYKLEKSTAPKKIKLRKPLKTATQKISELPKNKWL